jgi:hypothetical protein
MVFSKIDTINGSEMTQQIFNILVLNQFKSYKGNTVGGIDVGTTSMGLVMNQVNSLLSQVSNNVNIGLNYRPSSSTAGQETTIDFSTQLFNEKLLIDGLFGVNSLNPTATAQKANTIVGDIKIEYLLTKNRRWRIRAFNRTNTIESSNGIDILYYSPYTQGVGLTYQRDFARWADFFKSDKKKK